MGKLISFECKKYFHNKKNFVIFAVFAVLILGYLSVTSGLDSHIASSSLADYKSELQSVQNAIKQVEQHYNNQKTPNFEEDSKYYRNDEKLLNELIAAHSSGDWKNELKLKIEKDKNMIDNTVGGDSTETSRQISLNQYLYDHNIKPLSSPYQMTGFNFLRNALNDLLPFLVIILVVLLCGDIVSSESDAGTYKFLLLQPVSRRKVILSKIIVAAILSVLMIGGILLILFCIIGIINGFGAANYPTMFNSGTYTSFFTSSSAVQNSSQYIGVGKFILLSLPIVILFILFSVCLAVLISTITQSSIVSMCVSIVLIVAMNLATPFLKSFPTFSKIWPFSYNNCVSVLNQANGATALTGIAVLSVLCVISIGASCIIFKKQDITC